MKIEEDDIILVCIDSKNDIYLKLKWKYENDKLTITQIWFIKHYYTTKKDNNIYKSMYRKTKKYKHYDIIPKKNIQKYCVICKTPIYDEDSLYCSNSCRKVGSRRYMIKMIRKRRCTICGRKNNGSFHIHHVDKNHNNNTYRNLTLLCITHHYTIHYIMNRTHMKCEDYYKIVRLIRKVGYNKCGNILRLYNKEGITWTNSFPHSCHIPYPPSEF